MDQVTGAIAGAPVRFLAGSDPLGPSDELSLLAPDRTTLLLSDLAVHHGRLRVFYA